MRSASSHCCRRGSMTALSSSAALAGAGAARSRIPNHGGRGCVSEKRLRSPMRRRIALRRGTTTRRRRRPGLVQPCPHLPAVGPDMLPHSVLTLLAHSHPLPMYGDRPRIFAVGPDMLSAHWDWYGLPCPCIGTCLAPLRISGEFAVGPARARAPGRDTPPRPSSPQRREALVP